jgi:DNA-binding transcriptional ArsR family regulator
LVISERRGRRVLYRLADHHVAHIVEDAIAHARESANPGGSA